jgi:HSP20 family molecular chaperone IbpA
VEGKKEESENVGEIVHKGLAQRSFTRTWTLSDDTEVRQVSFADGLLTVELGKIVPDHHARKEYL